MMSLRERGEQCMKKFRDYDVSETMASVARALPPFAQFREASDESRQT